MYICTPKQKNSGRLQSRNLIFQADMVKLVDMPDLGSGAARRVGSSPSIRTKKLNEMV